MKEPIGREAEIIRNRRIELGMSQMEDLFYSSISVLNTAIRNCQMPI